MPTRRVPSRRRGSEGRGEHRQQREARQHDGDEASPCFAVAGRDIEAHHGQQSPSQLVSKLTKRIREIDRPRSRRHRAAAPQEKRPDDRAAGRWNGLASPGPAQRQDQQRDDLVLARHHGAKIELDARHLDAVGGESMRRLGEFLGGLQQRLGRDATDIETSAAEAITAVAGNHSRVAVRRCPDTRARRSQLRRLTDCEYLRVRRTAGYAGAADSASCTPAAECPGAGPTRERSRRAETQRRDNRPSSARRYRVR